MHTHLMAVGGKEPWDVWGEAQEVMESDVTARQVREVAAEPQR